MSIFPAKTDANNNALVSAQLATLPQLAQGTAAGASPHGTLRATLDPTSIFYDAFSGNVLDTVDRWSFNGTAPVQANGLLTFPAGTASTTSILFTKFPIPITASQHVFPAFAVRFEAALGTGVGRFIGLGTPPTTPSPTSLAQEGVGFELDSASSALQAVTYTGGVKTIIGTLVRPVDGAMHRISMQYRNSRTWWFIDGVEVYVMVGIFLNTAIQDMPVLISSVSGATLTNAPTLTMTAAGVSDLNRQATQISDGLFPHRKVNVGKSGGMSVKGVSIPVVSGVFAAAAVGTVGPVDVSEAGNGTIIIKNSVAASPYGAGGVVVFEQSDDNVSWAPLVVMRQDGVSMSTTTLAANTANASTMYDTALEGVNWVRARLTTGVTTNGVAINIQASGMPFAPIVSVYPLPAGTNTIGNVGVTTLPAPVVVADAATSAALAALSAVAALATVGRATINIELTGTWVGTVQFQATSDPSGIAAVAANWYPVNAVSPQLTALVQQTTANGQFRLAAGGYTAVRAFMTAFTSGSATAWVNASVAASVVSVIDPVTLAAGANTIGTVNLPKAVTPTTTLIPSSTTPGTLLAANAARLGASFYNDSTVPLLLKWGTGASITSYTLKVMAGQYYELPGPIVYSGIITGQWLSVSGQCLITEVI